MVSGVTNTGTKAITNTSNSKNTSKTASTTDAKETNKDGSTNTTDTNNTAQKTTTEGDTPYQQGFKAAQSVYEPQITKLTEQVSTLESQNQQYSQANQYQPNYGMMMGMSMIGSIAPMLMSGLGSLMQGGGGQGCGGSNPQQGNQYAQLDPNEVNAKEYDENGFPIDSPTKNQGINGQQLPKQLEAVPDIG